jgi:hypothetical protein
MFEIGPEPRAKGTEAAEGFEAERLLQGEYTILNMIRIRC